MKFYEKVEKLQNQEKNKGYIIIVRCGIFYTVIGKDAVIMMEKFGLTPICIKENKMNVVFIIGKVTEKIEFNFIYRKSKISIEKTKLELANKSIISIYGYDEMADYMYKNIQKQNIIFVEGRISTDMKVNIISIIKIC